MPANLGMDEREPARRAPTPHAPAFQRKLAGMPLHGSIRLLKFFPARAPGTLDPGLQAAQQQRMSSFCVRGRGCEIV